MSAPTSRGPGPRHLLHVGVHCVLVLLYFLPGGFVWNRVEPVLFGLPFGVLVTMVVLPVLIVANMVSYVAAHWRADRLVSSEVRRGVPVRRAERKAEGE